MQEKSLPKGKILVVDNHQAVLKFMTNLLENKGYKVLTAEDGLSALSILKNFTPDAIFIDFVMPNISGDKLCRIIRTIPSLKDVYIVILSGIAAEFHLDFIDIGADACIAKGPFNKMGEYVIETLERRTGSHTQIKGLENVYGRAVTKELLSIKKHFEITSTYISEAFIEITLGGFIIYVNPMAVTLTGICEEKLLASKFIDLFSDPDKTRLQNILTKYIDKPQKITKDSPIILNQKQVEIDIVPIIHEENSSIIILIRDITLQKQYEDKLKEENAHLENRLIQSQKMHALGTLASSIAHDFNNLLMGILGMVSLISSDNDNSLPYLDKIKFIEQYALQGSSLTKQLLDFSKGGKYEPKPTDLNELTKRSIEMFSLSKKGIKIFEKFQESLLFVNIDSTQIEQVLLNLYLNAWHAMPSGGNIYIQTENIILDKEYVKPFGLKDGNYVKVSVTDTGLGMSKEIQSRIFEPFFTTKTKDKGTGLGLASVYGIIKNHGGIINVYSEIGKGTTFNLYFPATDIKINTEKKQSGDIKKGLESVLLIDNEEIILDVCSQMLEKLGYQVIKASTPESAINIYEKRWEQINIVILDMIIPGMNVNVMYKSLQKIKHIARLGSFWNLKDFF
ncbi:MAG: response regulator, partial [Desulfobacterales bacterium]|nr:response regulator [Desulfobacterales bacterium]